MTNLKTNFVKGTHGFYSLFVNNEETNIYYSKNPNEWYHTEEKAKQQERLIKELKIFPSDGKYKMFDICAHFYANLQDAKEITFQPDFFNSLYHSSGSDFSNQSLRDKAMIEIKKETAYLTQWTKAIDKKTGEILKNVGVLFGDFGYSVYFY